MIHYLLDTNICIEMIRGRPAPLAHLRRHKVGSVAISSITLAELQYGAAKSRDPERNRISLVAFVAPLDVLPFDDLAATAYGTLRAELQQAGRPIGPLDMLIAAHALSTKLILVTNNEREFARVAGLHVENWVTD